MLLADPAAVVGAGVLCATLALYIFQDPLADPDIQGNVPGPDHSARVGLVLAAATCFAVVVEQHALPALVGAGVASGAAALLAVRWGWRGGAPVWSRVVVVALVCVGPATAATLVREPTAAASLLGGTQVLASLLVRGVDLDDGLGSETSIFAHPARILVVTFAALCAVGAVALAVPASSESGTSVGFLDAAFTSVSAVCVTGLIVLDTPNAYGPFGEGVIAVLIQVGGLGIMTFYTVALAALGRRLSLRHERALAGALNVDERDRLVGSVRRILLVTGVTEALGALVLFWRFNAWTSACATSSACVAGSTCIEGACAEPVWQSLWRAVFTSISAFCNAGFALQSDSLVPYQNDPFVVHTVGALIVLGGLSPVAVVALPRWLRGRRVDVQVALILWTSLALLVVGAVAYGLMEWTVSLGHLSWVDRVHNAWFQSVTFRTAGFNTVDLAAARPSTQAMMIVLMFVGGSPGGTAGGVKTTTAVVLLLTVIATLRGHEDATAFGRRIARGTVYKAAAVVT